MTQKQVTRYSGDVRIDLWFLEMTEEGRPRFKVTLTTPTEETWTYDQLLAPATPEITEASYNKAAAGAIYWAARYTSDSPEERPDWAPDPEVADEINDNISIGGNGFHISAEPWGETLYHGT